MKVIASIIVGAAATAGAAASGLVGNEAPDTLALAGIFSAVAIAAYAALLRTAK